MHQDAKGGGIIKSYLINGGKPVVSDVEHSETRRENCTGVSRVTMGPCSMPAQKRERGCYWLNGLGCIKFQRDPPQTCATSVRVAAG